jgi:hypothetical protein
MLSNMGVRLGIGDADLMMESGGDPDTKATRLRRSVARRLDCELARELRLAFDVVMDGSVADALSSLGRLALELRVEESLRCMRRETGVEAMSVVEFETLVDDSHWRWPTRRELGCSQSVVVVVG